MPTSQGSTIRVLLLGSPALVGAVLAGVLFVRALVATRTDDAQLTAHVSAISAMASGTIEHVSVENNQLVHAGDILVQLDDKDYRAAVEEDQSSVAQLRATLEVSREQAAKSDITAPAQEKQALASLKSAENRTNTSRIQANGSASELDLQTALAERQHRLTRTDTQLYDESLISRQTYLDSLAASAAATAKEESARSTLSASKSLVLQNEADEASAKQALRQATGSRYDRLIAKRQVAAQEAALGLAEAQLKVAKVNLERATIRAPFDGIVAARVAEIGQVVKPGDPLISVVDTSQIWVTANFKETQLRHVRLGDHADVHIDSSGVDLRAHVTSVQPGSGSVFTLLPPDNASGNFVKVVQRVPVRLDFDAPLPQRTLPGMSVVVTMKR